MAQAMVQAHISNAGWTGAPASALIKKNTKKGSTQADTAVQAQMLAQTVITPSGSANEPGSSVKLY